MSHLARDGSTCSHETVHALPLVSEGPLRLLVSAACILTRFTGSRQRTGELLIEALAAKKQERVYTDPYTKLVRLDHKIAADRAVELMEATAASIEPLVLPE